MNSYEPNPHKCLVPETSHSTGILHNRAAGGLPAAVFAFVFYIAVVGENSILTDEGLVLTASPSSVKMSLL